MGIADTVSKHRKVAIGVLLSLVALAVALVALKLGGRASGEAVFVQSVQMVNMASGGASANRYSGVIEAQKSESINLAENKTVKEVHVKVGDHVKKGDALFSYDNATAELEVQQAELELERLSSTISDDSKQIEQLQGMLGSSDDAAGVSAQIQELQAAVAQARYDLKLKESQLEKLRVSAANPQVTSPISGTIQTVNSSLATSAEYSYDSSAADDGAATEGDGGSQTGAFITILADGNLRVRSKVSEQNIQEVSVGSDVIVRSRLDSSITWRGSVSSVESQPAQDNSDMFMGMDSDVTASSYNFYVTLENSDNLMLGQHVTIELDYGQDAAKEGIWIDQGWVVHDNGAAYVWATDHEGGSLEQRTVTLGENDEELGMVQILAGLEESDYIAWPDETCRPGAPTTSEYRMSEDELGETDLSDGEMLDEGMDVTELSDEELAELGLSGEALADPGTGEPASGASELEGLASEPSEGTGVAEGEDGA